MDKRVWKINWMVLAVLILGTAAAHAEETLQARAILKANAEATISVYLTATVKSLPFRAGQSFKKGDLIIAFDCERYIADLHARKAGFKAKARSASSKRRLLKFGAVGATELAIAEAQMQEARALVEKQDALIRQCEINAPYDGKVVERLINEHETPGPNQPLIKIIDTSKAEVELIVPSRWLVWLKPGSRFMLKVDETGVEVKAKVLRIGAVVDAVSQTVKITGGFVGNSLKVLPGMSGTAKFAFAGI